jgi:RND family efflux transporter MFP subunit
MSSLSRFPLIRTGLIWAAIAITATAADAPQVEAVHVVAGNVNRIVTLPGKFVPYLRVDVHAKIAGFVQDVDVDRGSVVKTGQRLATMSAPELDAQSAEAEAKLRAAESQQAEAEARLVAAQSTYERMKEASATPGVIAGNDLVQAQKQVDAELARVKAVAASVRAAQAALKANEDIKAYLIVTAPFAGVITARNVHPGALVGTGKDSQPMFELETVNRLRLIVPVPEADVGGIVRGARVPFSVPAFPDEKFYGVVSRVSHAIDPKIRAMPVELDVSNSTGRLASGMYPSVLWPVRADRKVVLVPPTSVVTTSERTFVIRISGGSAEWVDIKRGSPEGDLIEIIGPVNAGDIVLRRGSDEIRPGMHVNVKLTAQKGA